MNQKEIWKDILNYEGLYQISNLGNVKSLERTHKIYNYKKKEKVNRTIKEHIMAQEKSKTGYKNVALCKEGKSKLYLTHRLVAQAFISNPNKKPQVNHKDGNKLNNNVENLEWVTASENNKHAWDNKLKIISNKQLENAKALGKYGKKRNRKVNQYSLNGELIKQWDSLTDIYNELGYSWGNISGCCRKVRKTSNGYRWEYAEVQ